MPESLKRSLSKALIPDKLSTSSPASPVPVVESSHKSKKLRLHASYALESPFPNFAHPTHEEASEALDILSKAHRTTNITRSRPPTSLDSSSSCGNTPNVIEALISTILSQNTSGKNSSSAKANLDAKFGRNNFSAIANAPLADVVEAIKHGGLANKKAATIQGILRLIKEKHGEYSLQHMIGADTEAHCAMTDDEIMQELISYDGVGPKTASCVLLFCLGRDSFAVDTHVFRLSKLLGWVPQNADRVLAQAHLDLRVPAEFKYGLHVLMVQHGRSCKGCKRSGGGACVLKTYLKLKYEDRNLKQAAGELSP